MGPATMSGTKITLDAAVVSPFAAMERFELYFIYLSLVLSRRSIPDVGEGEIVSIKSLSLDAKQTEPPRPL